MLETTRANGYIVGTSIVLGFVYYEHKLTYGSHHVVTLRLDGQLYLAPISDNVQVSGCLSTFFAAEGLKDF